MIKSITIKDVATFPSDGVKIDGLQKINFIYGGNGTGKTTLSGFLKDPSLPKYAQCSIEWEDDDRPELLVYNRQFKEENFSCSDIKGVFTLGRASQEEKEKIALYKETIKTEKQNLASLKQTLERKTNERDLILMRLKDWLWTELYKKYPRFERVYDGFRRKDAFYNEIIRVYNINAYDSADSYETIIKQYDVIFSSTPPSSFSLIEKMTDTVNVDHIVDNEIWKKVIVGKQDLAIGELIQKLNINDWVHEGIHHIPADSDVCPFCQQHTMKAELKKQFEEFFDEEFTRNVQKVKDNAVLYETEVKSILSYFRKIYDIQSSTGKAFLDLERYRTIYESLILIVESNLKAMADKAKEPSLIVDLKTSKDVFDQLCTMIDEANESIRKNNSIAENLAAEQKNTKGLIWNFLVHEAALELKRSLGDQKGLNAAITALTKKISVQDAKCKNMKVELAEMERNVTSVQPTIDAINKQLRVYGFTNFKIVPSVQVENCYQIQRADGSLANETLSEGEQTFISFLYFMQLVSGGIGAETVDNEKILVIDDPISSLDSNILFVVGTALKELFKKVRKKRSSSNIKQVICLTHNVYFHKEVSFIDGRQDDDNPANAYWILRKRKGVSYVQSCGKKNPVQSSYELLWKELREHREHQTCTSVQNIMRRILENYFTVFGNYSHIDRILGNFSDEQEREIARVLIVWVNDGSHGVPDDLYVSNEDQLIEEYYGVFEKIFKELGHQNHYRMMMHKYDDEADNAPNEINKENEQVQHAQVQSA